MMIFCATNVERLNMPNTYRDVLLKPVACSWSTRRQVEEGAISCKPDVQKDDVMVLYRRTYDLICDRHSGTMPLRILVANGCFWNSNRSCDRTELQCNDILLQKSM